MTERRFTEEEVATIFSRAAEGPQSNSLVGPRQDGPTLADLQEIGREVGISPEAVAMAAQSIDMSRRPESRTFLRLPIGVERTYPLNRKLTDEEWDHLVVQLRETFDARGTASSSGSLHQWTNGNLHVLLEPTASGHRLRLRTLKSSAVASISTGVAMVLLGAVAWFTAVAGGHVAHDLPAIALLLAGGLGFAANSALRLPGWARLRGRQMEAIGSELARLDGPQSRTP